MNVLIVDDDPISRLLLRGALERLGHQVSEAANGREAWAAHRQGGFQIVISDWVMPVMDGPELCRRIRAASGGRYTYFLLLTCLSGKGRFLEGMSTGADDFVTKPFDRDELEVRMHVAERILGLEAAVQQLEGMLPTCAYCKRIEDEVGEWVPMEQYIHDRSAATFSHGICPGCYETRVKPELEEWTRDQEAAARTTAPR